MLDRQYGFIETIYGRDGQHRTPYLTRVKLTPETRWGQLYLHIFHRGDQDPHPHDHPWDFWTFPLTTYIEATYDEALRPRSGRVRAWRLHRRAAEYVHHVLGREVEPRVHPIPGQTYYYEEVGRIVSLVWHGPKRRAWGFHTEEGWVHWRDYIYGRA